MLRLTGEDSPTGRTRIVCELESTVSGAAQALVECASAVKAWLPSAIATELVAPACSSPLLPPTGSPPGEVHASLALIHNALRGSSGIGDRLHIIAVHCAALARIAESAGAPLSAFLFSRLARDANARNNPDPQYTFEMARLATAVPELAILGREWLTRAALEARQHTRWDLVQVAVRSLADRVAEDGYEESSERLRRVAAWAESRARSQYRAADRGSEEKSC